MRENDLSRQVQQAVSQAAAIRSQQQNVIDTNSQLLHQSNYNPLEMMNLREPQLLNEELEMINWKKTP